MYKKNPNEETPKTITIKNCDQNIIRHGNDLCVANCGTRKKPKICLFIVDGENTLLKFELDSKQKNATLVAQYKCSRGITAVTLVNPDGDDDLKFIFRGGYKGKEIFIEQIGRDQNSNKTININFGKPVGTIQLVRKLREDPNPKSQGICYYNGLLLVPYTASNEYDNYIQVYGIDINNKKLGNGGKAKGKIPLTNKNKTKFEIEGLDYSNHNTWFFNTNEKDFKSKIYYCSEIGNYLYNKLEEYVDDGWKNDDEIIFFE